MYKSRNRRNLPNVPPQKKPNHSADDSEDDFDVSVQYVSADSRTSPLHADAGIDVLFNAYKANPSDKNFGKLLFKFTPRLKRQATKFTKRQDEIEDYVQAGSIGLFHACETFEDAKGTKFLNYALLCSHNEMTFHKQRSLVIYMPHSLLTTINRVRHLQSQLLKETGIDPSAKELGLQTDIAEVLVIRMLDRAEIRSLDEPAWTGIEYSSAEVGDFIRDENSSTEFHTELTLLRRQIMNALKSLFNRTSERVILMYFGFDGNCHSQEQIAKELFLSRSAVRKRMMVALKRLRKLLPKSLIESAISDD